jgi:hypothetical protein
VLRNLRGERILTAKDQPKRDPPQADQADTKVSKEDNATRARFDKLTALSQVEGKAQRPPRKKDD